MSRVALPIVASSSLLLSGCSVTVVGKNPPRDIDGDGRSTFSDLHASRSDAGFQQETDTRDYGQQLSDHVDHQRGGALYRDD